MTYPSILEFHEERMIFLLTFFARRSQILHNFMRRFRETNVVLRHECGDEQGYVGRKGASWAATYIQRFGTSAVDKSKCGIAASRQHNGLRETQQIDFGSQQGSLPWIPTSEAGSEIAAKTKATAKSDQRHPVVSEVECAV